MLVCGCVLVCVGVGVVMTDFGQSKIGQSIFGHRVLPPNLGAKPFWPIPTLASLFRATLANFLLWPVQKGAQCFVLLWAVLLEPI